MRSLSQGEQKGSFRWYRSTRKGTKGQSWGEGWTRRQRAESLASSERVSFSFPFSSFPFSLLPFSFPFSFPFLSACIISISRLICSCSSSEEGAGEGEGGGGEGEEREEEREEERREEEREEEREWMKEEREAMMEARERSLFSSPFPPSLKMEISWMR